MNIAQTRKCHVDADASADATANYVQRDQHQIYMPPTLPSGGGHNRCEALVIFVSSKVTQVTTSNLYHDFCEI